VVRITIFGKNTSTVHKQWNFGSGDYKAASAARRQFASYVAQHAMPDSDLAAAQLIFGELLTNALRYGRAPIFAQVRRAGGHALLQVEDAGPCFSLGALCGFVESGEFREGGRGLMIVGVLSPSVRVDRLDRQRCRVTAELPVHLR